MTPPAETTSSLRLEIPVRTTRAAHIIESVLKIQEEDDLSPTTNSLGDEVRERALASLEKGGGGVNQENLDISWRIFERLVEKSKDRRATEAELKKKLAEAEKEIEAAKATQSVGNARPQNLEQLLSEGDWASDIIYWVRSYEKSQAQKDKDNYVVPALRSKRIHGDSTLANNKVLWRISAHDVRIGLRMIDSEELKVQQWREEGSDETKTPLTPGLDRLNDLCVSANILRRDFINVMKLYAKQNEECHRKPPAVENFVVKEGEDYSID